MGNTDTSSCIKTLLFCLSLLRKFYCIQFNGLPYILFGLFVHCNSCSRDIYIHIIPACRVYTI